MDTNALKKKIEKLEIKAIDLRNTIRTYQERDAKRIEEEVKRNKKVNLK